MKIFVTGASGFIGSAVAAALSRAGHKVYGLVRTAEKGEPLRRLEIEPVSGDLHDPASYTAVARSCQVLVHCATEYTPRVWEMDRTTIHTFTRIAAEANQPRLFLYTSGVWVYGDTGDDMADEGTALRPLPLVAQRKEHEQLVLRDTGGGLRTLVIRPGCVYGGAGSLTAAWFDSAAREGAARVVGDGSQRWAMVHLADLADLYVRAAESSFGGEVFNATDRSRFTVLECARAASLAAGAQGRVQCVPLEEARKSMGPVADCLAASQHVDSGKAARLLGWQPRHGGFPDGAARYVLAWQALRETR